MYLHWGAKLRLVIIGMQHTLNTINVPGHAPPQAQAALVDRHIASCTIILIIA